MSLRSTNTGLLSNFLYLKLDLNISHCRNVERFTLGKDLQLNLKVVGMAVVGTFIERNLYRIFRPEGSYGMIHAVRPSASFPCK